MGPRVGQHVGIVGEVVGVAGLDDLRIAIHDHHGRVGFAKDLCAAGGMVEVRLAVEEDAGVGPAEAELLDAGADLRRGADEIAVEEDVAGGGGDEVDREVAAADVVEVAGDTEGCLGGGPVWRVCGTKGRDGSEEQEPAKVKPRACW